MAALKRQDDDSSQAIRGDHTRVHWARHDIACRVDMIAWAWRRLYRRARERFLSTDGGQDNLVMGVGRHGVGVIACPPSDDRASLQVLVEDRRRARLSRWRGKGEKRRYYRATGPGRVRLSSSRRVH